MTLRERIRAGVVIAIALLAIGFVFLGNQRPVHAETLGSQIVCFVFNTLDGIGNPIPNLIAAGCPGTPTSVGAIKVMKIVVGGTAAPSDFQIHVKSDGSDVSGSPQAGSSAGTTYVGIAPGTYTVSETGGPAGYVSSFVPGMGCDNGTVSVASSTIPSTCAITNTWSGTSENTLATCSDGIDNDFNGKTDLADPSCAAFRPTLTLVKNTTGGNGTFSFAFTGDNATTTSITTSGGTGTKTWTFGTSTMTETPISNWNLTSVSCLKNGSAFGTSTTNGIGGIFLGAGDSVTCTFANTFNSGGGGTPTTGTLVVKKVFATGTTTPSLFSFTVNGGSATAFSGSGENDMTVATGTYNVVETASSTYTPSYSGCSGVLVTAGATSTCVITNSLLVPSTSSDLSLVKTVDNTSPAIGANVTYTLTVTNSGPAVASNVSVIDMLPAGLTYVSDDSTTTGKFYAATTTGMWTIGTLGTSSSAVLHIVATVNSGTGGTSIINSATVTDTNGDPNTVNNTATVAITPPAPVVTGGGGPGPVTTTTTGGGGNGPISGSFGSINGGGNGPPLPNGQVLGASTSTFPAVCDQYLTAFIKAGQANDPTQVTRLQTVLKNYEGANIKINGIYDAATIAATEAFQRKYGSDILAPWGISNSTGYVYLTTRREINQIYCHFTQNFPLTASEQAIIAASRAAGLGGGTSAGSSHSSASTRASANTKAAAAAAAATMDIMGSPSLKAGSSSSVTNNPLNGIGDFFKKLFGL